MDRFNNNYLPGDDILQQDQRSHLPAQQSPHGQTQAQQQVLPQSSHQPAPPIVEEEELLAAQAAAEAAAAQQALQPGGAFNNVGQGLSGKYRDMMMQYWQETINSIEHDDHDFKNHQLPLARIKKVMKTDEDVRMISAEAPILFAKGCDVFITELTMRAWIHAEENKRRTLQKSDIAAALTKSDMFDFLIDVVPREEEKAKKYSQARTNGYSHPSYQEPVPQQLLQQPYEEVSHQQPLQQQQEQPQPQQLPQLPHQLPHQLPQQSQQFQSHLQQSTPTQEERSEQSEYMSQPDQTFPGKQEEEFAPQYQNPVGEDVLQQQMLHQQVMGQQESSPRPPYQQFNLYNQGYSEYQ